MKLTRRGFFGKSALAAVSAGALLSTNAKASDKDAPASHITVPPEVAVDPLNALSQRQFEECIGTEFVFHAEDGSGVALTLNAVDDLLLPAQRESKGSECFALRFYGPRRAALETGAFFVAHNKLGSFNLTLNGAAIQRRGMSYEAVINRVAIGT